MTIGRVRRAVASFTVVFAALTCFAAAAGSYQIVKRIPIAGDTGWDYITADTDGRRLCVPHGIEVIVLDLDTGAARRARSCCVRRNRRRRRLRRSP